MIILSQKNSADSVFNIVYNSIIIHNKKHYAKEWENDALQILWEKSLYF